MNRIIKNRKALRVICSPSCPSQRAKLLTPELAKALIDIVYNVLQGHVPIGPKLRKRLGTQKTPLRHLTSPSYSFANKQKYIIQKGGFLPFLLPLLPLFAKVAAFALPALAKGALVGAAGAAVSAIASKLSSSSKDEQQ